MIKKGVNRVLLIGVLILMEFKTSLIFAQAALSPWNLIKTCNVRAQPQTQIHLCGRVEHIKC